MKKVFATLIAVTACMQLAVAQGYKTTGGVRLGNSWGLTVTQRIATKWTLEGILQNDFVDYSYLHLLARRHHSLISRKFNVYYGGGLHTGIGFERRGIVGLDAIVGAEATLGRLNVSFDFKPQLMTGTGRTFYPNTAVSVRYVLVKARPMDDIKRKFDFGNKKKSGADDKGGIKWPKL
ncbi:MAG: hypothetical protein EAZ89_05720 [Bacteroidetes bacterium]|nr:MAG: hypothetical protein EAZ89_05720 [Bacteroidota bacterium]